MHQMAIDELTQAIVDEAAARFGFETGSAQRLGSFESFVYKGAKGRQPLALRLTHSTHRDVAEIQSEFDWMAYLAEAGAEITRPILSVRGSLTERIETPTGYFTASAQSWAAGACPNPKDPEQWSEALFREWGAVTGKLHRLTRDYAPPVSVVRRRVEMGLVGWDESGFSDDSRRVLRIHEAVSQEIAALPRTRETFGLCHTDIHQWNYHVHEGRMIVFDFDDSAYDSMAGDIAIALYYATSFGTDKEPSDSRGLGEFGEWFLREFMLGYRTEHDLPDELLGKLPAFVLRRQTLLHTVLNGLQTNEQWRPRLEASRQSALNGTPIFDMDYAPGRYR